MEMLAMFLPAIRLLVHSISSLRDWRKVREVSSRDWSKGAAGPTHDNTSRRTELKGVMLKG